MADQYKQYGQEKAGQAQQTTQVTILIIWTLSLVSTLLVTGTGVALIDGIHYILFWPWDDGHC